MLNLQLVYLEPNGGAGFCLHLLCDPGWEVISKHKGQVKAVFTRSLCCLSGPALGHQGSSLKLPVLDLFHYQPPRRTVLIHITCRIPSKFLMGSAQHLKWKLHQFYDFILIAKVHKILLDSA